MYQAYVRLLQAASLQSEMWPCTRGEKLWVYKTDWLHKYLKQYSSSVEAEQTKELMSESVFMDKMWSLCMTRWINLPHLHGSSLVIAYERGPPLNGDWLRQWHSTVGLIPWEVLQAAGVRLFLPVLNEQRRRRENTQSAVCRKETWWLCLDVILPVVLPLQRRAWSRSRSVRSPPPRHLWHQDWSGALHGSAPLRWGPAGGATANKCFYIMLLYIFILFFIFNKVAKFTLQKLTQKMAAYDKNKSTKLYLIVVLIQHDDNLSHIVEFRDSTEVIHGTLPLLVLLLLSQTQTKTQVQLSPSSEKHSKRPVELVLGCLHRANLHSGKCWAGSGRDSHWWNINVSWRGAQETSLLESTCQQDTSVVSLQPVQTPRIMSFHLI